MGSLSVRLLTLLTVALLPLGLIAVYQTWRVVSEAEVLSENEVLAQTVQAARAEFELIRRAHGVATALGTAAETITDNEQCRKIMRNFVDRDSQIIFAGFIGKDGLMACSSASDQVDFSGTTDWQEFNLRPRPTVSFRDRGRVTGKAVIIAGAPVFSESGELLGAGTVSFPYSLAEDALEIDEGKLDIAVVNEMGEILSSSMDEAGVAFLRALELSPGSMGIPEDGMTLRVYEDNILSKIAVVPLIDGESYLIGRWSNTREPFSVSLLGTATPVFPVLMWLTSLFVAFFAIDRLVLQHMKRLRSRMAAFSLDDLSGSYVSLRDAPRDIGEIASSYNQMVDRIRRDHEELEQTVREKDLLLKEVHHRVKNNLQLIASILNMQLRQIEAPEAKSVLRRVQDRVMSLATIHKSLYTDSQIDRVRVDHLLTEIIGSSQNIASAPGLKLRAEIKLEPIELDPDQAVPLSLLVTEAVTNAVKYAGSPDGGPPRLSVRLTEISPEEIRLIVENSCGTRTNEPSEGTGLGARLIDAFVQQLGGEIDIVATETSYTIRVDFPKLGQEPAPAAAA